MTYKYTGDGSQFIAGVPARDLTDSEFKALDVKLQKQCLESGLYVAPATPNKKNDVKETINNG
jgi:hypothetical protein